MTNRLQDRVAVITGAAQGNGRAIAEAFAKEGARTVIADISEAGARKAAQEIERIGQTSILRYPETGLKKEALNTTPGPASSADLLYAGKPNTSSNFAIGVYVDVTKSTDINNLLTHTIEEFGRVDILVNNAGVIGRYDFLEISESEWDRVIDINLKGTFLCGQAFARQMKEQGGGVIINIASVNAESVNPTTVHYCVSKGGVRTLTKAMALALTPAGIRVNAIGPGPVYTNLSKDRLDDPQALAATLAHIPMGRVAQPNDLAGAAVFLASDDSAYVTGITLYVDGGWLTI